MAQGLGSGWNALSWRRASGLPLSLRDRLDRLPQLTLRPRVVVLVGALGMAILAGGAIPILGARAVAMGMVALLLGAAVAVYPPVAAYVYVGITPLIAGIDRGTLIPVLRPNEALALLLGMGLIARGILRLRTGGIPRLRIGRTDVTILIMAVASSIIPLAWMMARHQSPEQDDLLYALTVWKYYGVYLLVRFSVRTEHQVRTCLWTSLAAGAIVAGIAILQSLQLFGITHLLSHYYTPYGSTQALVNGRGGSTLALPIAVADLMIFNLAIAVGFLLRPGARRGLLVPAAAMFVLGILASGEFSAMIELVLAATVLAIATRRLRLIGWLLPTVAVSGFALRPVLERRLAGFQTVSGLPISWYGRLYNLRSYFWPKLFSDNNFILGVRPAARVATSSMATGYTWIESGYTWLLWSGGIPFLLSFVYFLWSNLRSRMPLARSRDDAVGVAALAVVVALVVVGVMMLLDPHLTYRGSADLIFALLALTSIAIPADHPDGSILRSSAHR